MHDLKCDAINEIVRNNLVLSINNPPLQNKLEKKKTYPFLNITLGSNSKCLPQIPNLSLGVLPQRLLIFSKPNLPNLPALQSTLQLRQRTRHISFNERLHRAESLIQLAHARRLARSPELLFRAKDCPRQVLRLGILRC